MEGSVICWLQNDVYLKIPATETFAVFFCLVS